MDIASLGIAVDSKPVTKATSDLDQLAKQSRVTSGAVEAMAKRAGVSVDEMAARINARSAQVRGALVGVNDNLKGMTQAQTPLRGLSLQLASMVSPAMAVSVAIGLASTAAVAFYDHINKSGPSAEEVLKEQDRLVRVIKDSYDRASQSVRNFFEQSRDVTHLQLLQQQMDVMQKLREESGKVISKATTFGTIGDFFSGTKQIKDELAPFEDALFRLKDGFDKGQPSVKAFMDEVARIGLDNPALQKMAADLIQAASSGQEFENRLRQIDEMLKLIRGHSLSQEGRIRLGLPEPRKIREVKDAYDRMTESIQKRIERGQVEIDTFNMTTEAAARYRIEQELLNAALRAGRPITDELLASNKQLANEYARQEVVIENLERARDHLNATRDIAKGLASDLMNGTDKATAFANVLSRIGDKLLDIAFNDAFKPGGVMGGFNLFSFLGGGGSMGNIGGTGGVLGGLYHTGGVVGQPKQSRYIHSAYFDDAPRYHNGGIAGLKPNEVPAILERGERVIPNGADSGGMNVSFNVNGGSGDDGRQAIRQFVNSGEFDAAWVRARKRANDGRKA